MSLDLLAPQVSSYLEELVPPRHPELQKMEDYAAQHDFPIIGPVAGHLCYQLARLAGAQRVFELGSGYGYSTAWFARAVQENGGGVVHHAVWDESLSAMARNHLAALGYDGLIRYHVGEAVAALQATDGPFDIIFNDINKDGYPASVAPIVEKLRPGGLLIVDNTLWYGRIFDAGDQSPATQGVREVTRILNQDGWLSTLIPIRDGLIVAMKK
ncbi:MAG: O-methyltransferase [Chloroflexi bacterium]|nr:MAG: O-methyltransferase [Chloroflexota bacterium]